MAADFPIRVSDENTFMETPPNKTTLIKTLPNRTPPPNINVSL